MRMSTLSKIVEELSSVLDKPAAEKVAEVILSVQESMVIQRLEAIEDAVRQLAEEMRRSPEQFREHRVAFQEYR